MLHCWRRPAIRGCCYDIHGETKVIKRFVMILPLALLLGCEQKEVEKEGIADQAEIIKQINAMEGVRTIRIAIKADGVYT